MKPIRIQVWKSELTQIGDWCIENIGDWAFSGLDQQNNNFHLNNYVTSNLNWEYTRYRYIGSKHKKCWLHMHIKNETDIMAVILRWSV